MTTPLLVLLLFAAWTLLFTILIGAYRWTCFLKGKVPKGGFPSDKAPPDGYYRRILQAHKNCIENLAIYGAIVVVLTVQGLDTPLLDNLALAVLAGRVLQSLIHAATPQVRAVVLIRFSFYFIQVIAFIWMIFLAFQG